MTRLAGHSAEAGLSTYGLFFRFLLLPTSHRRDALTIGYM
jgi:hypothetical protein